MDAYNSLATPKYRTLPLMGYFSELAMDQIERESGEPDDSGYLYDKTVNLEGEMKRLHAELAASKAETARLSAILSEVRFFCTYDRNPDALHARVWPLVVAFDNPPE